MKEIEKLKYILEHYMKRAYELADLCDNLNDDKGRAMYTSEGVMCSDVLEMLSNSNYLGECYEREKAVQEAKRKYNN